VERACFGPLTVARQLDVSGMSARAEELSATYDGAATLSASTSAGHTHTVDRAATVTAIASDGPDPSSQGAAVTVRYTVTVSDPSAGTATGTVTVSDGVDRCIGTVAAGQCTIALTSTGSRMVTADYAGDDNFRASSSPAEPHTVAQPESPGGPPPTGIITPGVGATSQQLRFTIVR
jgi:hypothetical protein